MLPIPKFETDDLLLRPFSPEDAPALYAYLMHPDLAGKRYLHWKFEQLRPFPEEDAAAIIKHWNENKDGFVYAIILKANDSLIGHVKTDWGWDPHMPDIAVVITPDHQRKGYGSQAISLVLDYLYDFTMAHNISTYVDDWNIIGQEFAQSLGFKSAGTLRRTTFREGRFYDEQLYDLLRPEWKERRHAA